jgi:DNA adenine methylase
MSKQNATKSPIHIKAPVVYYGGKQQLLPAILPLIPPHKKYVEPFLGGGAVYWAKEPSEYEVINDLDGLVVNFYEVVKSDFESLDRLVKSTAFGRLSHEKASVIRQNREFFSRIDQAWAFWTLCNSSLYGDISKTVRLGSMDAKPVASFYRKAQAFGPHLSNRLQNTFIECRNALYVIEKNDSMDTFFFIDPPYFNAHMGHYSGYTKAEFEA